MPTPLGHSLLGLAVMGATPYSAQNNSVRERAWLAAYCVTVANLPDFDFIWWNGGGFTVSGMFHHGVTHSFGFAVIVAAAAGIVARLRGRVDSLKLAILTATLYSTHVLADLLNEDNFPANGVGLPAFWPLTDTYFIFPILPGVNRTHILTLSNMGNVLMEILFFGSIMMAIWGRKRFAGKITVRSGYR